MPTRWLEAEVKKIENLSEQVKSFQLQVMGDDDFNFIPGQFITFDLPIGEKRLHRWRSYSIASPPNKDNALELCVVRMENGVATSYLFESVHVGSVLKFKGPEGGFILPEKIQEIDMVMLCTGTGVAPFRSMLKHIEVEKMKPKRIHLIFGARTEKDILYRAEFEKMKSENSFFHYDIALSRDKDWKGYQGHIHQVYLKHYGIPKPGTHFYICGWSKMIDQAVANLIVNLNYDKSQIHYELYG